MFVLALIDGLHALTRRHGRRRVMVAMAVFAAFLHGGVWPLFAVASDGQQTIEICTSDGVKRVLVDAKNAGVPIEAPIPAEHSECATCVCAGGGCAGMACVAASEIVVYDTGPDALSLAAQAGRGDLPYALSPSRDPPAI